MIYINIMEKLGHQISPIPKMFEVSLFKNGSQEEGLATEATAFNFEEDEMGFDLECLYRASKFSNVF